LPRFGEYTEPTYRRPRQTRARPSFENLGHLKRLYPYFVRYRVYLIAAVVGILIARFVEALVPLLMKTAIDSLVTGPPNLLYPALGIAAVVFVRFFIYIFARRLLRRIAIATAYDLRRRLFNRVLHQGAAFYAGFTTGDIMSRSSGDIGMVRGVVSFAFMTLLTFIFTLSTGLVFMFALSPQLALACLIPTPLIAIVGAYMSRRLFPLVRDQREAMADVTSFVQENFNGIRTVQAMAQEKREINRFTDISSRYASLNYRTTRYRAKMNLIVPFFTVLSPLIIFSYGGFLVLEDEITVGTFTAFFAYMAMVTGQIGQIGGILAQFSSAAASAQRLFEIIDQNPEIPDQANPNAPSNIAGHVEFKGFSYAYPNASDQAVTDINIDVKAGEAIAFVGRVGSGKSTILKSLVRLVDPAPGTVLIDGHDVADYSLKQLRNQVALIPQDAFLFSDSIKDNITYDDPSREDDSVWEAAETAQLADAIREFPDELETLIGERGITLSGGQKQRATLSRGLIREASILAMDDCFAAVDTRTEERILTGIKQLRGGKTTFLISHRVSTARHADRIFVLEAGRIIESGSHQELITRGGFYANLERVQSNQERDRERKLELLRQLDMDIPQDDGPVGEGDV
jgi:ATP-binding cassette, subfamily B, multidrug efflux pump